MKKFISVIVCLAMCICMFAGCGNDSQTTKSEENLTDEKIIDMTKAASEKTKSVRVVAKTENIVSVMGQSVTTSGTVYSEVDLENGVQYGKIDMEQDGITTTTETYVEVTDDDVNVYINSGGMWIKQTQGVDLDRAEELGIDPSSTVIIMDLYLENLKGNSTRSVETVDGKECYVFESAISGSNIELLKSTALKETLNKLMETGLDTATLDEIFSSIGDIEYRIAIDKETFLPIKIELEMSEAMDVLMKVLFEAQGLNLDVEVTKCDAVVKYTDYNNVSDIVIPDEALEGTEIAMY